jgi:cytochrome c oxidase subunit IV
MMLASAARTVLCFVVMEWTRLILEYLKVLLSAPVIIGVVVVFLVIRFRDSIRAVLERPITARAPGV